MSATDFRKEFVEFAIAQNALRFGEFKTKAGRLSPYFFNSGLFSDGASMSKLADFYARATLASGVPFDMIFGPAYKGITLAAGMAIKLADKGRNVPFAFNRKEAKDHGEGGLIVGAPLAGRVLIVDDVISAGTSVRESVAMIRDAGATPAGVVISVDRQEKGLGELSAAQEVSQQHGIPVIAVAALADIVVYLSAQSGEADKLAAIVEYRTQYGAASP
ncbi:MAG: orotate phosphoribosyltransferase [Betaproteobacteria bacterium]